MGKCVSLDAECCFFFFQAEDGIRDYKVTGVQTCALPIWRSASEGLLCASTGTLTNVRRKIANTPIRFIVEWPRKQVSRRQRSSEYGWIKYQIGRASCRERV